MTDPAIVVEHMSTTLAGKRILDDVNLSVEQSRFVGVVGPNGAGKTTLLRSILGTIPTTGSVAVCGVTGKKRSRAVGYVPQQSECARDYPIDVATVVITGLLSTGRLRPWARRADTRAAAQALDEVGMSHVARRPFGALSGGQRQRVLLARALVARPKVLLLDEPGTGLDLPAQAQLFSAVKALTKAGVTVVMSTHDLGDAVDSCDELVIVNGTVVAHTPVTALPPAEIWMDTFGVEQDSHLLRTIGVAPTKAVTHR